MGLSLGVGVLAELTRRDPDGTAWLKRQVAIIQRLLAAHGLPPFEEPEAPVVPDAERPRFGSFPYAYLHCLRRFAARCKVDGQPPPPLGPEEHPERDRAIERAASLFDFHLLVHSDSEGFYVPVDFADVIFDRESGLAGGMLGSSVRLLRELAALAPALQITVAEDLAREELRRIEAQVAAATDPFWRERMAWTGLFQAARASTRYQVLLAFR
ncbi:MAG: hypothetical protein E6J90_33360 [Deltaproteobacteria bacterium]|nr:MAG: hypothetical protein E6J90_33360 [Deltaproteobacteria bacterium]TMQ14190.1 MAG: hypothetical protein E6J91_16005 [Deltaproteobacteria bacterium]